MPTTRLPLVARPRAPLAIAFAIAAALLMLAPSRASGQPGQPGQDSTLDRARTAIEANQAASVTGELAAWVKAHPRSAAGHFWLGRAWLAQGDWEKAADRFEAVELDPGSAQAHYFLGAAYGEQAMRASKLRQPFLAKKVQHAFERAVQLDPDYLDARTGLLDFYRMAPGFMGGGMDKARAQAAEIRKRDPLRGAYAFAGIALAEKKLDVAAQEYERAIAAAPDSVGPYLALGELRGRQGHWADAWTHLDRYRARRPSDPRLPYFTGRLAGASGQRLDEGEQALALYLQREPPPRAPSHGAAHWRLGQIREHRQDVAGARREYETAVRLDSSVRAAKQALDRLAKQGTKR
jgi:tetratricopeptide (TPR) repeat protein